MRLGPALLKDGREQFAGVSILIWGWAIIAWYANVGLLVTVIASRYHSRRVAVLGSVLALGLGLTMFGYITESIKLELGAYLWLASIVVSLTYSIVMPTDPPIVVAPSA